MAIIFQCSHCEKKMSVGDHLSGSLLTCTGCGRPTRVDLLCPKCRTSLTAGSTTGGERVQCAKCQHVFRVKMTTDEADVTITAMGSRTGAFSQKQRRDALPAADATLKQRAGGGYCEGMALDWLRRVIQGGRPSYQPSPYHDGQERTAAELTEREHAQTRRGARAYDQRYGAARDENARKLDKILEEELEAIKTQGAEKRQRMKDLRDRLRRVSEETDERYTTLAAAYNACTSGTDQLPLKPGLDKAREDRVKANDGLNRIVAMIAAAKGTRQTARNQATSAYNARQEVPELERIWTHLASVLDGLETAARQGTGRGKTSRPFAGLQVKLCVPAAMYTSPATFARTIVGCPAFLATTGILIGFNSPVKDKSGHAVAAYRQTNSVYLLFDPNIGMYSLTAEKLVEALDLLFTRVYDDFAYEDGRVSADYSVFGHDGPVTPSVLKTAPALAAAAQQPPAPTVLQPARPPH